MFEATIVWSIILALAIVRIADVAGEFIYDYVKRKQSSKRLEKILEEFRVELEREKKPVKKAVAKKKPATSRR
jgi:hypothetical protein